MLDIGLRYLSYALATAGAAPPTVFAAHLGEENLDLWVAPADRNPPPPWTAVGDGQVWRLPLLAVHRTDLEQTGGALAPFPGLVSIGTDGTGRVLVDLEAAHGLIAVTGPEDMVSSALSAIAVELATNRWSDRMQITLVGFGAELATLAPERITAVPTLAEALPALETRAAEVEAAMVAYGVDSALAGRSLGGYPETWAPHYVIMAGPPSPDERERLLALARVAHAAAAAYLVAGDVPGAAWTWEVTDEGRLLAAPLGFDVEAQLLPARQQAAVADLVYAATLDEGVALSPPSADAAPAAQLIPDAAMPVEISLLGRLLVQAPGVIEPDRVGLATELVVYLAAHPGGVHPNVLTAAIWPRGVTAGVRDAALARATDWLGTDSIGRPHLATDASGRLGSALASGWTGRCSGRWWRTRTRPPRAASRMRPRTWAAPWNWSAASCWTAGTPVATPGWPPMTWNTRWPRRSRTPRTGCPGSGWRRLTRIAPWRRPGPGCASRSTTSCSGAICSAARRPPGSSTSSARWWTRCAPGWRWTRCCPGWPPRPSRSSTRSCRPGAHRWPDLSYSTKNPQPIPRPISG